MSWLLDHLVVLPIIIPLTVGALLLFINDRHRAAKAAISFASMLAIGAVAVGLMLQASAPEPGSLGSTTYLLGNWSPVFAIVLVADRVSALLILLAAILGAAASSFAAARWDRAGPHFYALFQFLLMGVSGAFLTGDLFNLFVFFEVMLAASYGLLLHGSSIARVKSGLHYIAINLVASLLFLVGTSLIYGVTGTLNMADLAVRIPMIAEDDRMLLEVGAAVLGTAFLIKAGMWPLGFWLPPAYGAAAAPVAAVFAILSKVGVYSVWRLSLLFFGDGAGESAHFAQDWLLVGGLMTIVFGSLGVLASQSMVRLAGFSILVSSGTLLASIGLGNAAVSAGALFYLVSSTLSLCALFMLVELVERTRAAGADVLDVTLAAFGDVDEPDYEEQDVGIPIPATLAILGGSFIACTLLLAGLPPFSGFIAKFAIMTGILNPAGEAVLGPVPAAQWWVVGLLIVSGLAALVAMTRMGINTFWAAQPDASPTVNIVELAPIVVLLGLCLALTVLGGPAMAYFEAAAAGLHDPTAYVEQVRNALPVGQDGLEPDLLPVGEAELEDTP